MHTIRKRKTKTYLQSEGNVAVVDESLGVFQQPKAKTLSPVRGMAQGMTEEVSNADALAPATGIVVGIGLSAMLWCLIVFVMYWVRLHL